MLVESQAAGADQAGLPQRREPDLAGLAAFTLDRDGRVVSWSATAATLFGLTAADILGHDICDVLMTGPGQRDMVRQALDQIAAGQVWSATLAGGLLGDGRYSVRAEPMTGGGEAMVIVRRAGPQSAPSWLGEAAATIGSTLDVFQTAAEVATVAVPGFADAVAIHGAERLLAADEFTSPQGGRGALVRRLAARLRGKSAHRCRSGACAGGIPARR